MLLKHIQNILLIFWLTASVVYAETASTDKPGDQKTILVFGDSLSAAYNIKREQGWVTLLQNFLVEQGKFVNVVNASISGETTSGGRERLPAALEKHQPDIVILELGGNDGLRGFDLKTTRENLLQMISLSESIGARVLLTGIEIPPNFGRTYTSRFRQIYKDLGAQDSVTLMPFILQDVATHQDLMQADGIHPNAKGQPIIMRNVWQYLMPMMP